MAREYILECWDGTVWEFNDPACPISLMTEPTGIEGAQFTFDTQQNVNQAGDTVKARNDDPNFIGLDAKVGPVAKGDAAAELLRLWRHSLGRGLQLGTFHTISDEGGDRFQKVRLATKLDPPNYYQMRHSGVLLHDKCSLRSDETWWRKYPVVETYTGTDIFAADFDTESDEPVWPHLVITGPITNAAVGWEGQIITLGTIPAGHVWTINSDPDYWEITSSVTGDRGWVGDRWRKRIPAGTFTDRIDVTGSGTTSATSLVVTVPQLFWEGI